MGGKGGGGLRLNSASCKDRFGLRVELTNIYAYHCTPYISTKFKFSILIKQNLLKGRFAALRKGTPHICISLYSILYE